MKKIENNIRQQQNIMNYFSLYTSKTSFFMIQLLLLLFCCLNSSSRAATDSFLTCLSTGKIPDSIIYTQKSQNYTSVLQDYIRNGRFNTPTTLKPTLILTPLLDSQVQQIVICAKQTGLLLKIRSGGHDFEGLSYTSKASFVVLDMFNLRSIEVDIANETAWVQSGATIGELFYQIWQKSKVHAFPAGVCPTMAIGGHISGGGYGNLLRKYGLTVDNVVDARIVDANGTILDRKAMGEDLFWAITGGGGASFGVVLSYKIKLVPVPAVVTVFKVSKTLEQNATEILHRWQFVADKLDKEVFIRVNVASFTTTFIAMYLGDADKLVAVMTKQFPELGLRKEECKEMSWIRSVLYWAEYTSEAPETALLARNLGPGGPYKIKSDYVTTQIPVDGIRGLIQLTAVGIVKFNPYGGRMSEIPESATPFPHRAGNIYKIQYGVSWEGRSPVVEAERLKEIRKMYDYMTSYVSENPRRAFLNYRDIDIGTIDAAAPPPNAYNQSKVYGIKYFGHTNFERLVRVKTMVDPTNFFRDEQSIYPSQKITIDYL